MICRTAKSALTHFDCDLEASSSTAFLSRRCYVGTILFANRRDWLQSSVTDGDFCMPCVLKGEAAETLLMSVPNVEDCRGKIIEATASTNVHLHEEDR